MSKYLIPSGSLTGDPIGTQRFMEVDEDNPCTAASSVVFYPDGRIERLGSPVTSERKFSFNWAGGLSELNGKVSSVELQHSASDMRYPALSREEGQLLDTAMELYKEALDILARDD